MKHSFNIRINASLSAISLACLLGACAVPPKADNKANHKANNTENPPAAQAQTPPEDARQIEATPPVDATSADAREVNFSCQNGENVVVRFMPAQGVALLVRGGNTIQLQQQPSGSGFAYGSGPNAIRGKGDDLTVEIGRMKPIQCKAR